MSNEKKYLSRQTLFRVKCIDPSGTAFLTEKWYDVIEEKQGQFLIRFKTSGAANWYSKSRFKGRYYE